jgi:hypothetical protein
MNTKINGLSRPYELK